jgi:penicillin-binding protein 1C
VNGRPLAVTGTRRDVQWRPDGPGFARVTVIDADGRNASADFEVR